jgi:hypothetical protein
LEIKAVKVKIKGAGDGKVNIKTGYTTATIKEFVLNV